MMINFEGTTRIQGIDFDEFVEETAKSEYPMTCEEVVERHGDCEVSHANGRERIADVLGAIDDTFGSADEVRQAVVTAVGSGAVGRARYTDRNGEPPEERDNRSVESF